MTITSRSIQASPGQRTRAQLPQRDLPIIVVPGIMGTRLVDSHGRLVWNPVGFPISLQGRASADANALSDIRQPLYPTERPGHAPAGQAASGVYYRGALIGEFYHDLVDAMHGELRTVLQHAAEVASQQGSRTVSYTPKVYCCGYDWRQSNANSVRTLSDMIDQACGSAGGEPAILICHSMGGLLARYALKTLGALRRKVRAVFLVGSPTLGAVQAYVRLKRGVEHNDLTDRWLLNLLWPATMRRAGEGALAGLGAALGVAVSEADLQRAQSKASRRLLRHFPSIYQLLPNDLYCVEHPTWLHFESQYTGYQQRAPGRRVSDDEFSDCGDSTRQSTMALGGAVRGGRQRLYRDPYAGFHDFPYANGSGGEDNDGNFIGVQDVPAVAHWPEVVRNVTEAENFHRMLQAPIGVTRVVRHDAHAAVWMPDETFIIYADNQDTVVNARIPDVILTSGPGRSAGGPRTHHGHLFVRHPDVTSQQRRAGDGTVETVSGNPRSVTPQIPQSRRWQATTGDTVHAKLCNNRGVINHLKGEIREVMLRAGRGGSSPYR